MKSLILAAAASAALAPAPYKTGVAGRELKDDARQRPLSVLVWYPTESTEQEAPRENGGGLFQPTREIQDAPLPSGKSLLPLVLLSHGDSGNKLNEAWLAERLARRGYIVAAVDHYGNTSDNTSVKAVMQTWDRPLDLSFVLTQIEQDQTFGKRIDKNRVYAVGHSAGGAGVVSLAGGRMKHAQLESPLAGCDASNRMSLEVCNKVLTFDYRSLDKDKIEASYADPRFKKVVSLDPGFYAWFDPGSLDALAGKAYVVVAGTDFYKGQGLKAEKFAPHFGQQGSYTIRAAHHFDFLPECTAKAKEQGLPLCRGQADRQAVHDQTEELVAKFLAEPASP